MKSLPILSVLLMARVSQLINKKIPTKENVVSGKYRETSKVK